MFRMTAKRKHNKVTLKTNNEALEEFDKNRTNKEATIRFNFPRSPFSTWKQPISTIFCWIDCFWISWTTTEVITDEDDENKDEESNELIAHPWKNEADETIKTLSRLSLFTEDLSFDPLISEPTGINNQWRDKWGHRK